MRENRNDIQRVVNTYSDLLLRLVLHDSLSLSDAEDIVQNTFIKYMQKAPEFHDDNHEKAWLIRVASNEVKDVHKSWWKRRISQMNENYMNVEEQKEEAFVLLPYIRKLPQGSRRAIYLFYYEGYSIVEIAKIYDVKEATVASWLHRGRKKLKGLMKGEFDDELE
ncbi:RNA polymerase sigma factor [Amedibacillus sp. YH-ame6]